MNKSLREELKELIPHSLKLYIPAMEKFILSKLSEHDEELRKKVEGMREHNVCTCERRVCHCGKFPTAKETDAYNRALSDILSLLDNTKER